MSELFNEREAAEHNARLAELGQEGADWFAAYEDAVAVAHERQSWRFDYPSWEAFAEAQRAPFRSLPPGQQQLMIDGWRRRGMADRAIAPAAGMSEAAVNRLSSASNEAEDSKPAKRGIDGRAVPPTKPPVRRGTPEYDARTEVIRELNALGLPDEDIGRDPRVQLKRKRVLELRQENGIGTVQEQPPTSAALPTHVKTKPLYLSSGVLRTLGDCLAELRRGDAPNQLAHDARDALAADDQEWIDGARARVAALRDALDRLDRVLVSQRERDYAIVNAGTLTQPARPYPVPNVG